MPHQGVTECLDRVTSHTHVIASIEDNCMALCGGRLEVNNQLMYPAIEPYVSSYCASLDTGDLAT